MTVQSSVAEIEQILLPNVRDLGDGFQVRRALAFGAAANGRPVHFLDSFSPVAFHDGQAMDVRPHPHIGLSTVTYLLEGAIVHRDSEGYVQDDQARRGQSDDGRARHRCIPERSGPEVRARGGTLAGLQSWIALPRSLRRNSTKFSTSRQPGDLPYMEGDGARARHRRDTAWQARVDKCLFRSFQC